MNDKKINRKQLHSHFAFVAKIFKEIKIKKLQTRPRITNQNEMCLNEQKQNKNNTISP